jgi:flagellar biosynthetic protein FlhB
MSAGGDKTEKATPKRRSDARRKGQVARSVDLNGAIVLAAGFTVLVVTLPRIGSTSADMMREALGAMANPGVVTREGLAKLMGGGALTVALAVAPVAFASLVAGLVVNVAQVGWKPSAQALKPQPSRINPLSGAKNLFGPRGLVEGLKGLLKVMAVGGVLAILLFPSMEQLASLVGLPVELLGSEIARYVKTIAIWGTAAYLIIGIADVFYQRHSHEKQMKMSKDEVKREAKDQDLPPEVRGKLRQKQREQARARMMGAVPTADVVVTNPTHYAVALRYDGSSPAPELVAKGKDLIAARIRELATEAGIPIVEDPPLARSIHRHVEVGEQIPESLFAAVAQVLAFVYRHSAVRRAAGGARGAGTASEGAFA